MLHIRDVTSITLIYHLAMYSPLRSRYYLHGPNMHVAGLERSSRSDYFLVVETLVLVISRQSSRNTSWTTIQTSAVVSLAVETYCVNTSRDIFPTPHSEVHACPTLNLHVMS
jgi:hypothetical protein